MDISCSSDPAWTSTSAPSFVASDSLNTPLLQGHRGERVGSAHASRTDSGRIAGTLDSELPRTPWEEHPGWRLVGCENGLRIFHEDPPSPSSNTCSCLSCCPFSLPTPVSPGLKCVTVIPAPPATVTQLLLDDSATRRNWDPSFLSSKVVGVSGHAETIRLKVQTEGGGSRGDVTTYTSSRTWKHHPSKDVSILFAIKDELSSCPFLWTRSTHLFATYVLSPFTPPSSPSQKPLEDPTHTLLQLNLHEEDSPHGCCLPCWPFAASRNRLESLSKCMVVAVAGLRDFLWSQPSVSNAISEDFLRSTLHSAAATPPHGAATVDSALALSHEDDDRTPSKRILLRPGESDASIDGFFDCRSASFSDSGSPVASSRSPRWSEGHGRRGEDAEEDSWADATGMPTDLSLEFPVASAYFLSSDWSAAAGSVRSGPLIGGRNCWSEPDASQFFVRGPNYLRDRVKVPAAPPLFQLAAVDWLKSPSLISHVARRPQNAVQRISAAICDSQPPPFFFIINLQVPGVSHYSLVLYFATQLPIDPASPLSRFIEADDAYRNKHLTLIPGVPEGSWIVKKAVGSCYVPLGKVLKTEYWRGGNYIEIDVNMATSAVVRGVMSLVTGVMSMLVVDMAFLVQGDYEEDFPDQIIGVVRGAHLELNSAVPPPRE